MERLHAIVRGRVQGVGFRYFTERAASGLALKGWVRNLEDGTVELTAEGPRELLEQLLEHVQRGPRASRVEHVEARWLEAGHDLEPF